MNQITLVVGVIVKTDWFDNTKFYNYYKNRNEDEATKRTIFSPNSATAERQLANQHDRFEY